MNLTAVIRVANMITSLFSFSNCSQLPGDECGVKPFQSKITHSDGCFYFLPSGAAACSASIATAATFPSLPSSLNHECPHFLGFNSIQRARHRFHFRLIYVWSFEHLEAVDERSWSWTRLDSYPYNNRLARVLRLFIISIRKFKGSSIMK